MKYVIAASHLKIKRRFGSHSSKKYWQCVKSVKPEDIHVQASSQRNRLQIELQNDHNFLSILEMRKVVPDYETRYPNIAANVLKGPPHYVTTPEFELFNDTTCKQYHRLFIDLVSQYQHFVNQIAALAKEGKSFEDIVDLAVKTGHALLTMVKDRAFYLYLSTIASKLSSPFAKVAILKLTGTTRMTKSATTKSATTKSAIPTWVRPSGILLSRVVTRATLVGNSFCRQLVRKRVKVVKDSKCPVEVSSRGNEH